MVLIVLTFIINILCSTAAFCYATQICLVSSKLPQSLLHKDIGGVGAVKGYRQEDSSWSEQGAFDRGVDTGVDAGLQAGTAAGGAAGSWGS